MGMTDYFIIPKYALWVGDYINENLKPGDKIAWLGQQQMDKYSDMFLTIEKNIKIENLEHHFYDILNDDDPPVKNRWDIHESWENKIKGYDLVLGIRIAYLVQSASGLVKNFKYAVENNKKVLFDFNTGNIVDDGRGKKIQSWTKGSKNLIPHFSKVLPSEVSGCFVPDKDSLLSEDTLSSVGLKLNMENVKITQDPVKWRYYVLAEIIKK